MDIHRFVPPRIVDKLKEIATQSRKCELCMASETLFEVMDFDKCYISNFSERTCACGAFQG